MLLKHIPIVVKRVIDTQWSAHYEALKALQHYFLNVVSALNELCDQNENIDSRGQARGILDAIQRFFFVSFLQFWMEVLKESYDTQKYLATAKRFVTGKLFPQGKCFYCFCSQ